ncbi:MAG: ABC transporter ATP-binding protein [Magnetococcales bacterium]|nr:ABC transporter ATP-binding protein [Magnetococcales bacterium]
MQETMIKVSGLSRTFGTFQALDGIDFSVQRGEVMGFLGPNGAGKTTTMRILTGLLSPTEGAVSVGGFDLLSEPEEARAITGFLPENPPIYDEMTVREYLIYLATLRRVEKGALEQAVNRALSRCGLVDVADRLLSNLSKGYRQRAGIAQAIVHSPKVLILDEPTVGLDPIQIREIRSLIRELAEEHSVLLSTHILPEIRMTCDRVTVISNGRIVAEDTIEGLEQRAHAGQAMRIVLAEPPSAETLESIAGVQSVSEQDGALFVTAEADEDPITEIVKQSVEKGWNLREMTPMGQSLEEIFVQLAGSDPLERSEENSEEGAEENGKGGAA